MVDIDGIARDAAEGVKDSAGQVDVLELSAVRSNRRRRTAAVAAAGAFTMTLIVVGVAALGGGSTSGPTDAATVAPTADQTSPEDTSIDTRPPSLRVVSVDGVELEVPSMWELATETLTPSHNDPLELVSLATFPLSAEHGVCGAFPSQAVVDFPADGAFITIRERFRSVEAASFTARPVAFDPQAPPYVLPEGDCLDNTSRGDIGTMRWFPFSESGRFFELIVVIGTETPGWAVADTWDIVNSLEVESRDLQEPLDVDAVYAGNAFVLDRGTGPEVCQEVNTSLPPQCGGPSLVGLDWVGIPWSESAQGVTWATMYIEVRIVEGQLELVNIPTENKSIESSVLSFPPPPADHDVTATFDDIRNMKVPDWPAGIFWVSSFGPDEAEGTVHLSALIITEEGQQWLDNRYGVGAVQATGNLQPIGEIAVSKAPPPAPRAPSLPGEPDRVRARDTLYYCGAVLRGLGSEMPSEFGLDQVEGAEACFQERIAAGQSAELIVVQHTIEGDPILSIFRVLPDGSAEVYDDTTRDRLGSQAWFHYTCETFRLDPFAPDVCSEPQNVSP